MPHITVIRVYTTRIAKSHDELLISPLLLLLILPIYLGMCHSVPTHIHPYMSKLRLLLETDDEIYGLCLQWVPYMPGITTQGVPLLVYGTSRKVYESGSYIMPIQELTGGRDPVLPSDAWRPSGRSGRFELHNISNTTINIFIT